MNHRADFLYRLSAEGLLATLGAHHSRNTADENALPVNSEDLVNPFFPALLGVTDWADRHAISFWNDRSIRSDSAHTALRSSPFVSNGARPAHPHPDNPNFARTSPTSNA
jgi:hypothetical protein